MNDVGFHKLVNNLNENFMYEIEEQTAMRALIDYVF